MLSPTGWWLVTAPVDLRGGMDRLWLHVRGHLQQDPVHGGAYVFRNRAGTRIKVLHVDPLWCRVVRAGPDARSKTRTCSRFQHATSCRRSHHRRGRCGAEVRT